MTLQQLRAFLAIVEFGSFRRAARELGISQAGLTTRLKALEAELGVMLLQRSAQGTVLTPEGKRLLPRAQLMSQEAQRAYDEARSSRGEISGTLHVGLGPTPTAVLLPRVVPDFHARYPAVKLKLISGFYEHLQPALLQGRIELALTAVPDEGTAPGLRSRAIFKSDLVVVSRAGHPKALAQSLHELADCEWILLGSPGEPGGTITRFHNDQGLPAPRVAATCESLTQLAALMAGTDWLALLPQVMVESGLLGTKMVPVPVKERAPRSNNCLMYRSETPLTPAAAAFAAMCESCARVLAKLS